MGFSPIDHSSSSQNTSLGASDPFPEENLPSGGIRSQATEVFLVSNPLAGAKSDEDEISRLKALLRERGLQTQDLHSLETIRPTVSKSLSSGRLRAVVCVGGDGTAAAVVNRTPPETPLVLLPRGTENLLAKYTGQPFDPDGVGEMILAGHTRKFDVGRAGDQLFLLMLSAGFDADVVHRMAATRKGHITHWSWAKPIWDSLRRYQYPELRLSWQNPTSADLPDPTAADGVPGEREPRSNQKTLAKWVFVSNLPCYARGLPIAPEADGTDGLLDVCAYGRGSFLAGIRLLVHTLLHRHHRLPDCQMLRSARIRLESDAPVPYQIDGDPGGWLPVEIEIIPERMRLVVPEKFIH